MYCIVLYERGGMLATHQCSYAVQVLGAGHMQGNVLIVSWISMFDFKGGVASAEVERAIRNGQGWIRSTHFNHLQPKAQP